MLGGKAKLADFLPRPAPAELPDATPEQLMTILKGTKRGN
jgi:hypothetical protein